MTTPKLPKRILQDVVWTIRPMLYESREEFDQAIRDYHVRILKTDARWQPEQLVLPRPRIEVQFEAWVGERQVEQKVLLETGDPRGWTVGALMFAVHQRIADWLAANGGELGDHCFFEGLSLRSGSADPPVYDVDFGS